MQLSTNQKNLINLFLHFPNVHQIWNTLKKKVTLGSYLVLNLETAKSSVTYMATKPRVRTLSDSQHIKGTEKLLKSAPQYFFHIYWSLWIEISSKKSVLVVSVILRVFVNILIPDDTYSLSVKASVWWNPFKCNYLQTEK